MLGTFILGILAGWAAPHAEPKIAEVLQGLLPDETPAEPREMAHLSLVACLIVAAVLAALLASANAVSLTIGAALGVLGPRLVAKWKARREPDYDS